MLNIIKKFVRTIFLNKRFLIAVVGLIFLFTLLPSESNAIQALWEEEMEDCTWYKPWNCFGGLISVFREIGSAIAIWVFLLPVLGGVLIISILGIFLSFIFYAFSALLLSWVASDYFVSLPLTHGGIVDIGWQLTRNIVNMGFILILVFIALATILRLETYRMKKLLPRFILVVLLINFSQVICGAVVDVANIIQANFLTRIQNIGHNFIDIFLEKTPVVGDLYNLMKGGFEPAVIDEVLQDFLTFSGLIGKIVEFVAVVFYGFFAGSVFLLYVLLFMLRIIVIWILVILSPIAWACWILPRTQHIWRKWWSYFIQWSFLGAIAAFFLYLGGQMIAYNPFGDITQIGEPPQDLIGNLLWPFITILNNLFLLGGVILFLLVGFFVALKASSAGTEMTLSWAEKQGGERIKLAREWAKTKGKAWAREKVPEKWRRRAERMAMAPPPKGKLARFAGAPVIWVAGRAMGKVVSPEAEMADIAKARKKAAEIKTSEDALYSFRDPLKTRAERIGMFQEFRDKNWLGKLEKLGLSEEEIIKTGREALTVSPEAFKEIRNANPYLAERMGEGLSEEARQKGGIILTAGDRQKGYRTVERKLIAEMKPEDIGKLSLTAIKRPEAIETIQRGSVAQLKAAIKTFGRDYVDLDAAERRKHNREASWFAVVSPGQHKFRGTSVAQQSGVGYPEMATEEKKVKIPLTEKLEKEVKEKAEKLRRGELKKEDIKKTEREIEDIKKELELREEIRKKEGKRKREVAKPPSPLAPPTPPEGPPPGTRPGPMGMPLKPLPGTRPRPSGRAAKPPPGTRPG